ncbi:hypothetical protein ACWIUD_11925 [Helicobacter sp. 23-1044]
MRKFNGLLRCVRCTHAPRNDEMVKNSAFSYNSQNLGLPRFCFAESRNDGKLRQILRIAQKRRI